jgi:hypothetical protein
MGWKQERDSLIAQTLAFVQSVTGRREEIVPARAAAVDLDALAASLERSAPHAIPPKRIETSVEAGVEAPVEPALKAVPPVEPAQSVEPPPSAPTRRPIVQSEMQEEIRARIASFRAHQERFNREREEYFSATLARLRAVMKDSATSRMDK